MKINSITTNTGYLKGRAMDAKLGRQRECAKEKCEHKQNNNDKINTTIKSNSDGRVNFKGSPSTLLHKVAHFTSDKPLLAEAIFALSITCAARPLTIMATAKTEEDKEKCHYQVAKSIASGLIGLAATALISTPISKATKTMEKSGAFAKIPEAIKEKYSNASGEAAKKVLGNYPKTAKNVMDKLFQPIFLPLRAKLTIMAVPVILSTLGLKKKSSKQAQAIKNNVNFGKFKTEREKELFQSFSGVNQNENK